MKTIFSVLLLLVIVSVSAQEFPSDMWHEGKLITVDGDTLRGNVKYSLETDAVQLEINKSVKTYSARKIIHFDIYDEYFESYRQFYALPYETSPNYKVPVLFEVLYEGPLTLLCREYITQENVPQYNTGYYNNNRVYSTYRLSYKYFFVTEKGKMIPYYLKKKDILEIMQKKGPQIKQFIKTNNLKHDRRGDLVRITAYYNSLLSGRF